MRMSGVGGSENHLRVLLPELPALGWEPDVLIPSPSPPAIHGLAASFSQCCRRVTVVRMRADLSPSLAVRIARLLRSGEYQIVHSHLVHADWYVAVASVAAPGVALVSTKHNDDPFRRTYPFRVIERAMSNRCTATITISEALRDFTLRYSPPRTPIATVLYGLKAPRGAPGRSAEFDSPTLLAVARLVRQKGLDILIQAMRPIKDSVPDARLLLAGDGPERPALERLARDLGLADSVRFLGHRDDVDHLMRRAWVLVHPSRWEGFGLVLLEAMKQGMPVVAARVSAVPEIVVPGATGLLVPPEDPRALAAAVITALGDERFRRDAGMRGFERLVERFSAERMARETAAIYDHAVSREGSRARSPA